MTTITIIDINEQSFMTEVDTNDLNEIHGGGPVRDWLHEKVDQICDFLGL
ncbi:hypothetical protein [Nostoc sp. DedQUE09]|nr:hypothetical protein [Nostoc sp. DedQUE09]MDZ7955313.1 hypothetical protein [Nostoc sp. DedQUE09]